MSSAEPTHERTPIHWSSGLEKVVKAEGEKALVYSYLHGSSQVVCSWYANALQIPVIILSTLSGTASVGTDLYGGWGYAPVIIGLISILCGVLNTLNSYFAYSKRAEGHRIASLHFAKVHNFILIELALPRTERMAADDLLKVVREQSERLQETSPQLPRSAIAEFKERFGDTADISKPWIANGLDPIEVYVAPPTSYPRLGLKVDDAMPVQ